ncbi:hypothetical protein [Streptomyces sp. NPDC097619]|uniref:hypothetical protein n=1 Tax=Streptomyces sp. NPDC097619 TaxID=3157228 RepID=UPI0033260DDB
MGGAQAALGMVALLVLPYFEPEQDDHGVRGPLFGLLPAPVLVPVFLVLLATLLALCVTKPAGYVGEVVARRSGREGAGFRAAVGLAALVPIAALAALPVCGLAEAPYPQIWAALAGAGVLPLTAAAFFRHRGTSERKRVTGTAVVAGAVLALLVAVGVVAAAGQEPYRAPVLDRAGYVATWSGDGTRLVLAADGTVRAEGVVLAEGEAAARCSGPGTWRLAEPGADGGGGRQSVAVTLTGCPGIATQGGTRDGVWDGTWQITGTAEAPELFRILGDPDENPPELLDRTS